MSKGSTRNKVLRTGLKRVQEGWIQKMWVYYDPIAKKVYVCMEGAIYGYCMPGQHKITRAQHEAAELLREIILERSGLSTIPDFNDFNGRTQEEAEEIFKLAIIRDEAESAEDGLDNEDIDNLLEFKDSMK